MDGALPSEETLSDLCRLRDSFTIYDTDKDGQLNREEIAEVIQGLYRKVHSPAACYCSWYFFFISS